MPEADGKHVELIINASAGGDAPPDGERLARACAERGLAARIRSPAPGALAEMARHSAAARPEAVVVMGGDGSISTAAGVLASTDVPLGILPAGTFNHFARDLGVPLATDAALDVVAHGRVRRVDVAEVNGRVFVNNSSLGLYPKLVHEREERRRRHGIGKRIALVLGLMAVFLRRVPLLRVTVETTRGKVTLSTPFLFIGNNEYRTGPFGLGSRERLDGGRLLVLAARCRGRLCILRLAAGALFGRLEQSALLERAEVSSVRIDSRSQSLRVALDGELVRMKPPLDYRVRAGALRVLVGQEEA